MIQRIQTLFLSLALLLMGVLFWFPLAEMAVGESIYTFTLKGVVDMQSGATLYSAWYLLIYWALILGLEVFAIFSFKNRVRQIRVSIFSLILMVGFVLVGWVYAKISVASLGEGVYSLKLAMAFPFVAAVLNYLAIRAINRDELLVRSVDRIR